MTMQKDCINRLVRSLQHIHTAIQLLGADDRIEHIPHFSFISILNRFLHIFFNILNFNSENEHMQKWKIAFECDSNRSS